MTGAPTAGAPSKAASWASVADAAVRSPLMWFDDIAAALGIPSQEFTSDLQHTHYLARPSERGKDMTTTVSAPGAPALTVYLSGADVLTICELPDGEI